MFRRFLYSLLALILPISSILISPPASRGVSSSVVISEFRTRGPSGGNDEFIELYNLSSSPVSIGGWEIRGSSNSGTVSTRAVINSGTFLNPGCHYLLTNSNPTGGPYSGSVTGNQTYGVGITDDGGIALTMPGGTIVDQVGLSSGAAFKEGTVLAPLTTDSNRGYERRPGGGSGSNQDTDNNQNDFRVLAPSDPQNASSQCLSGPPPQNLSGTGSANPSSVNLGNTSLLTVNVNPAANPSSTGITVMGNLSSIGGASSQQFFDDGTDGDAVAGDNNFSYLATVTPGTTVGTKSLDVSIADAQGRSASASIVIKVVSSSPQCGVERWSVKTGTDIDAALVDLTRLTPTTIETLQSLPRPTSPLTNRRANEHEKTVFAILGTLTLYKLEEDSDYHLVVRDEANRTIITEVPCPCCVGTASPFAPAIENARAKFDARFTATGSFKTANVPVLVTGVGFFDFPHGQTGAAANNFELHPVLDIRFISDLRAPIIAGAWVSGKKLFVAGFNFDEGAKIFLNGEKQKTTNDSTSPTTVLIGKKAGKKIDRGLAVRLQVKNSDGRSSEEFVFFRLAEPSQLSPPDAAVFSNFPRTTTVTWGSVPGAVAYSVEIDCFHCCQRNAWCTDVGGSSQIIRGLTTTSYTFEYYGAQPGRWRVWAVGEGASQARKQAGGYFVTQYDEKMPFMEIE
jgi:hypothetical protein